jgi:ATP-dependent Clp protease protease subunit
MDSDVASSIIAQLLFLNHTNSKEISMYINSPGGLVSAGLAIYDTMQFIKPEIQTMCVGEAASMGAILLAAGTKGKRLALPNARMMIHQPQAGYAGDASSIQIHADETLRNKTNLERILALHTKQDQSRINIDSDRDFYMTAEAAVEYGLIDEIVEKAE